ncbi:hypothetical protein KUTeg_000218 [Tegillarca granosa]|uniref:Uncharacterized protein n=1 Tax=Tegillarca granosa TaxID=220873 RepID=A0ABQ9G0D3_TEGGR|nr:hypothetical protein KUTeg_000218 [Tegillarca granosa]
MSHESFLACLCRLSMKLFYDRLHKYGDKTENELNYEPKHAFQPTKAIRSGDQIAAEKVRETKTKLEAKYQQRRCCSKFAVMDGYTAYRHVGNS